MRQLCNVAYAEQVDGLEPDKLKEFDANLVRGPGAKERRFSKGTDSLMKAMSLPRR